MEINLEPIGIINSPFKKIEDRLPIQGRLFKNKGSIQIFDEYSEGLKDLEGFSYLYLIYFFDRSQSVQLRAVPYLDDQERGIFSIRSPHRPNHLGLTVVNLIKVNDNNIEVEGLDVLDQTPLIDIKPYNFHFDYPGEGKIGWMTKYFSDNNSNRNDIVDSEAEWLHQRNNK